MSIKLLVTSTDGASVPAEYVFDGDCVRIGRDPSNELALPDSNRVVSKHHAELRVAFGVAQVVDLGSKNFTYLNGRRLQPEQPYPLNAGDAFRIGSFEVQFQPVEHRQPDQDRTVFAASFVNPFQERADALVDALNAMSQVYERELGGHRDDALADALHSAMDGELPRAVDAIVNRVLGGAQGVEPSAPHAFHQPAPVAPPVTPPPTWPPPAFPSPSAFPAASGSRLERLSQRLVQSVARVVSIPWQFRHEFIGQTIIQSSETAFLYENDPASLSSYLLDPGLSDSEFEARLTAIDEASNSVAVHQIAMLDGYRAAVQDGARRLVEPLEKALEEQPDSRAGGLQKLLGRGAPAAQGRVQVIVNELKSEDWSVSERRVFRPAFVKAYLARMTRQRSPADLPPGGPSLL
jgi:type VI secretion system protein ImpI